MRKLLKIRAETAIYAIDTDTNAEISQNIVVGTQRSLTLTLDSKFGANEQNSIDDEINSGGIGVNRNEVEKTIITCSYSNTSGFTNSKRIAIQVETDQDRDFMGTELLIREQNVNRLCELGKWAKIVAADKFTYSTSGQRVDLGNRFKKLGYGTGVVTKNEHCMRSYTNLREAEDRHFEILPIETDLSPKCKEARIIVYRSPSMKNLDECKISSIQG